MLLNFGLCLTDNQDVYQPPYLGNSIYLDLLDDKYHHPVPYFKAKVGNLETEVALTIDTTHRDIILYSEYDPKMSNTSQKVDAWAPKYTDRF